MSRKETTVDRVQGTELHPSLRASTNIALAALWLAGLVGISIALGRVPWLMIALGAAGGAVQGTLQRKALVEGGARFHAARTSHDVRAILVSTRSGHAQVFLLWVSGAAFVIAGFLQGATPAFFAVLAAILAQWLVREALSVGACVKLARQGPPANAPTTR
jgi:hypothetical protein